MKLSKYIYWYPQHESVDCNTYLIRDEKAIVVDVGSRNALPVLIENLHRDGVSLNEICMIANTHLHLDHMEGNDEFKEQSGARIEFHKHQEEFYSISAFDAARYFRVEPADSSHDGILPRSLSLGRIHLHVIPTPGHSPDSICFYCPEEKFLLSGDLIFYRNTGRFDLPGGDRKKLKESIHKVAKMDIELMLPGHMKFIDKRDRVYENFEFIKNTILPSCNG